jgi:K+-transporting ATPase ATPase B chain
LAVSVDGHVLRVIALSDVPKPGMGERIKRLREMGIRTIMVTGDNPVTALAVAAQAGVDDFVAEAKPEEKLRLIRREQAQGRLVAMTGDGTNDAPALAQADVGLVMHSGTIAAKEAANLIDLDSDPTKLIDLVSIGNQMPSTSPAPAPPQLPRTKSASLESSSVSAASRTRSLKPATKPCSAVHRTSARCAVAA